MQDIFNSNAFEQLTLAAAVQKIPYKPTRLGPGGLALFDEKAIGTLSIAIEEREGQLSLIDATARGSAGDYVGDKKANLRSFHAQHLRRNAKIMADEVQGVRLFGTEDQMLTVEQKRNEKLQLIVDMHAATWEFHRAGALVGKVLDADGVTILLDVHAAFDVSPQTHNFEFSDSDLNPRKESEAVADLIDLELGASMYERLHVICGGNWYDAMIDHAYVKDALRMKDANRLLEDRRNGFEMGPLTFERAKRWAVKDKNGTLRNLIDPDKAYAFPIGAATENGPMFIGRFAPQPFNNTVNRLNPPLVVKPVVDPADQFIELIGISCPLFLNTRPAAVIELTKS